MGFLRLIKLDLSMNIFGVNFEHTSIYRIIHAGITNFSEQVLKQIRFLPYHRGQFHSISVKCPSIVQFSTNLSSSTVKVIANHRLPSALPKSIKVGE
jgi:hypothetical protein